MISPFTALLISSQDATINIEPPPRPLRPCVFTLQVGAAAHTSWPRCIVHLRRRGEGGENGGGTGEAHAFIIKVSWDALQHLEVLKRALLREYVGIAHTRKLAALPADDVRECGEVGGGREGGRIEGRNWVDGWVST